MTKLLIFNKKFAVDIIFYNGNNKQEVIDFFKNKIPHTHIANFKVINDELYFETHLPFSTDRELIKPNYYLLYKSNGDGFKQVTPEEYKNKWVKLD